MAVMGVQPSPTWPVTGPRTTLRRPKAEVTALLLAASTVLQHLAPPKAEFIKIIFDRPSRKNTNQCCIEQEW